MKYNHFDQGYEFTDKDGVQRYVHHVSVSCGYRTQYYTYPVSMRDNPVRNSPEWIVMDEYELYELKINALKTQINALKKQCASKDIAIETEMGTLTASINDEENYPEISICMQRPDTGPVLIAAVEVQQRDGAPKEGPKAVGYLYGTPFSEEFTDTHEWTLTDITNP